MLKRVLIEVNGPIIDAKLQEVGASGHGQIVDKVELCCAVPRVRPDTVEARGIREAKEEGIVGTGQRAEQQGRIERNSPSEGIQFFRERGVLAGDIRTERI